MAGSYNIKGGKDVDRADPTQVLALRVTELAEGISGLRPLIDEARKQIRFGYLEKTDKILQVLERKIDELDSR